MLKVAVPISLGEFVGERQAAEVGTPALAGH